MKFIAYDFETANNHRSSACSLGAVKIEDGQIVDEFYSLINPAGKFLARNIDIHGIQPLDVIDAPGYPEVMQSFSQFVDSLPIVSHTPFDVGVIKEANYLYRLSDYYYDYFDSYYLAKSIWDKRYPSYSLGRISKQLGFEFNHHDALDDAKASANLILTMADELQVADVKSLIRAGGYPSFGRIQGWETVGFRKRRP